MLDEGKGAEHNQIHLTVRLFDLDVPFLLSIQIRDTISSSFPKSHDNTKHTMTKSACGSEAWLDNIAKDSNGDSGSVNKVVSGINPHEVGTRMSQSAWELGKTRA